MKMKTKEKTKKMKMKTKEKTKK